jgi:tetratricopeptide (TPR) repeat protein
LKKLVLKTTIITLAAIIGAFMITFGVLIMATPKTVAGIFDDIGGYSASVFFYEKQYDKTGSIEDLAVLVDKLDMEEEPLKVEGYLETLLSREDFKEYCEKKDANKPTLTTKEYYYGNYVIVLIQNGRFDKAVEVADKFVDEEKYTKNNPFRVILSELSENLTDENLNVLKSKLNYETYLQSGDYKTLVQSDLKEVKQMIEDRKAQKAN